MLKGWNARSRLLMVESNDKEKVCMLACVAVVHRLTLAAFHTRAHSSEQAGRIAPAFITSAPALRSPETRPALLCVLCRVQIFQSLNTAVKAAADL